MTNDFECFIMKHREEGIAKDGRNVLDALRSAFMFVFTPVSVRFVYLWLGFVTLGYVWLFS
jgi:hypothetical protein